MSDDLVARLRGPNWDQRHNVVLEAADEIERLRKVIDELAHMEVQEVQRLLTRADINAGRAEQAEARLARIYIYCQEHEDAGCGISLKVMELCDGEEKVSEIAARLRSCNDVLLITGNDYSDMLLDAANEIERLREQAIEDVKRFALAEAKLGMTEVRAEQAEARLDRVRDFCLAAEEIGELRVITAAILLLLDGEPK